MEARELNTIVCLKPEPQTTPSLALISQRNRARETVADYRITSTLRLHFKRVFECVVHHKGQGFWVQAEYGAGKTHFLGTLLDLLLWPEEKVWEAVRDEELRGEYAGPVSQAKLFPVAFSLRGMGQAEGEDSLMRVFEEQIRESLRTSAPELDSQVPVTSAELAVHWYAAEATEDEKAGVASFFQREHQRSPEEFRSKQGAKKFGQELVRSRLPEGRLRGKFKERFAHLYDQITKLGGYDGLLFVVDEFRSWQDRHPAGTAAYAEDEEILETLAFVLPSENRNVLTLVASQGDLREYAEGRRREAVKKLLKCQLDEYRRGKVLTQKGYAVPSLEIFKSAKGREEDLAGRLLEKAYGTPLFSAKDFKKDFTDGDAKKVFGGLFHKEPAKAEKDAVQNFAVGLELAAKAQPTEFQPVASQALAQVRTQLQGQEDVPLSDLKSRLCCPPYGLTEPMVMLYVFTLIKSGGYELALKPSSGFTLSNGKPVPRDRITAHLLLLCEWNAKLDKALHGARLVRSTQRGWNEVLPFARVLDPDLKPAANPDEEQIRNEALLSLLGKLRSEIPETEKSLAELSDLLGGTVPVPLKETCNRLNTLAATGSYQEFDANAREGYPDAATFAQRYGAYERARKLRDRAFSLSQMVDYLGKACTLDPAIDFDRRGLLNLLKFEALLNDPSVLPAREEQFERWKGKYEHAYRKAHRAHHERLEALAAQLEPLRPRIRGLSRMNQIAELGPALPATATLAEDLTTLESALWLCPDAVEAKLGPKDVTCPKCGWQPERKPPTEHLARVAAAVTLGLSDRFQRFKDATISSVLKKASAAGGQPGLSDLLEIIQLADADRLADVLTEEFVSFLRQLLYDENLVDEQIGLAPILQQVGAIEENRIEESLSLLTRLLAKAIKDAKAKHGQGKRVRVFLRPDDNGVPVTNKTEGGSP
jgi:hypothetical protein